MPRTQQSISLKLSVVTILLIAGCAGTERENIVDPVNTPTIEMSALVVDDDGSILIEWRYLDDGSAIVAFRVTRALGPEHSDPRQRLQSIELGRVSVAAATDGGWQTASLRDTSLVAGVEVTYQVTGILGTGDESTTAQYRNCCH